MVDNFDKLPSLVVKKIYSYLDNRSRQTLFDLYEKREKIGLRNTLKEAGCFRRKEILHCFLCQCDIFYGKFAGTRQPTESAVKYHYIVTSVTNSHKLYRLRNYTLSDIQQSNLVLHEFEHEIDSVYQTNNLQKLQAHILKEHRVRIICNSGFNVETFLKFIQIIRKDRFAIYHQATSDAITRKFIDIKV